MYDIHTDKDRFRSFPHGGFKIHINTGAAILTELCLELRKTCSLFRSNCSLPFQPILWEELRVDKLDTHNLKRNLLTVASLRSLAKLPDRIKVGARGGRFRIHHRGGA